MPYSKRLPRKLKKQLKKDFEEWKNYKEKRRLAKERNKGLDMIFTRNYSHGGRIIRRMIRTGR